MLETMIMTLWVLILDHQAMKRGAVLVVTHLLSQPSTSTIIHTVPLDLSIQRRISSLVEWVVEKELVGLHGQIHSIRSVLELGYCAGMVYEFHLSKDIGPIIIMCKKAQSYRLITSGRQMIHGSCCSDVDYCSNFPA